MRAARAVRPAQRGNPILGVLVVRETPDQLNDGNALAAGLARARMVVFPACSHNTTMVTNTASQVKRNQ